MPVNFKFNFALIISIAAVVSAAPAHAHLGHLGDLAGHTHWVGVGAVVVAGGLAWVIGKLGEEIEEDEDQQQDEDLAEGSAV